MALAGHGSWHDQPRAVQMTEDDALRLARAAFARRDWAMAREHFRAAPALSTQDQADLATACWWLGLVEESIRAHVEVHRRSQADGSRARAALAALLAAYCEQLRGHHDAGAGWLARARRLFDEVPGAPERGYLLAVDVEMAIAGGQFDLAEELAGQVLELGEQYDDPTLQAHGCFATGELTLRRGRVVEAKRWLDEAMLPVQADTMVPEWTGNLYCRMIQLCHELADLPRAHRWTTLTEEWCRGYAPAVVFTGICRVHRVQLWQAHGEWSRAEQEARRAADDLVDLDVLVAAEAHYRLGEVHRLRGDLTAAEAAYRRAHEMGRDPLPGLALLHLCRGHGQVAASILDAALAAERTPWRRAPLLAARAEAALESGATDRAAACVEELGRVAEQHSSPGWLAETCRWRGAVLRARGRHAEAVGVLHEARDRWQEMDAPYDVARVRLELADAAEALGDQDTADRERQVAAALLERLGARRDLERLRARRRARRAPGELSPRELEVVAAVASGSSNRDVASRLHISERTVARHLANVYTKTGSTSRTGAVAWARDRGLL